MGYFGSRRDREAAVRHLASASLALALVGSGCAPDAPRISPPLRSGPALAVAPLGALVEQWIQSRGNVYLRRPRPDFSQYRSLHLEAPGLFYSQDSARLHARDLRRLSDELRDALAAPVAGAVGLPIDAARGPGVLRVRAEASELDFNQPTSGNSRVTSMARPSGAVLFVLDLADDATGDALVRFVIRQPLPGGTFGGSRTPELARAERLFRSFAKEAGEALGQLLAKRVERTGEAPARRARADGASGAFRRERDAGAGGRSADMRPRG